jgi:beta-lactamase class A
MKMITTLLLFITCFSQVAANEPWVSEFETQIARMEETMPGRIGVYIKQLGTDQILDHKAGDDWYLSSTVKIPLAIAILQKVEAGELSLDDELVLRESDFVDGAGDLLRQRPGSRYTIAELLEKMVRNSDSSATDMLMRLVGEEEFNRHVRTSMVSEGFHPITTLLQVRYDAYSEFHQNAMKLTNLDILHVNGTRSRPERVKRLIQRMEVTEKDLKVKSIEEAFERYYQRKLNTGTLESFGLLLERLYEGELLTDDHTKFLLNAMEEITTGDSRIMAGLTDGYKFAQKTGTQIERACNIGIIYPDNIADKAEFHPVIVAACVEEFGQISEAERVFQDIGHLLSKTLLQ